MSLLPHNDIDYANDYNWPSWNISGDLKWTFGVLPDYLIPKLVRCLWNQAESILLNYSASFGDFGPMLSLGNNHW